MKQARNGYFCLTDKKNRFFRDYDEKDLRFTGGLFVIM